MKKTTRYYFRNFLIAAVCVVVSAFVGLVAAACMDSISCGVAVAIVVLALYGVFYYLFQTCGAWMGELGVAFFLLLCCVYSFVGQEWLAGACCGAFCVFLVWYFFIVLKSGREDVRAAKKWEAINSTPAVRPYPVSTEVLVTNMRAEAAAHPETSSLNKAATCFLCWGDGPDFDFYNTLVLLRKGEDWCASFGDIQNHPDRACIPWLAVRHLFIRETGYIEPSIMAATETLVQGLVFQHNGKLQVYPASLADEFIQTWGSTLFSRPRTQPSLKVATECTEDH